MTTFADKYSLNQNSRLRGGQNSDRPLMVSEVAMLLAPLGNYLPLTGGTLTGALTLNAAPTLALHATTKQYVDNAIIVQVTGLWDDRGNYDASTNLYPSTGGSGIAGAILKGDIWTVTVAGTLGGTDVELGDTVRVLVDTPGQITGNWAIGQHGLGYAPLSSTLNSGMFFIGNASNVATPRTIVGDVTFDIVGNSTIGALKVIDSMINDVDWNKVTGTPTTLGGYGIVLTSGDVTGALGFTPYNATNPAGYISGITSGMVTGALGYTPYNASNPASYISGITSGMVTTALGYTPYNSTNPAGYISSITSGMVTTALGFTPFGGTDPLPISNGGTNSNSGLVNNRIMISTTNAIKEHSVQTPGFVSFYDISGLPSGDSALRWNNTTKRLGIGVAAGGDKLSITATGTERGLFITSAVIGAAISTSNVANEALNILNDSGAITPVTTLLITKAGHIATIGSGSYISWNDKVPTNAVIGNFGVITTDITAGTYKTAFVWNTPNQIDGTLVERMCLTSGGVLSLTNPIFTGYIAAYQAPNTADSNTITNTTTETNFTGTGITLAIPANTLQIGDRIVGTFWGIYSALAAGTLTIRLKNNAVTMVAGSARGPVLVAAAGLKFTVIMTVRSIGAGGTVSADLETLFDEGVTIGGDIIPSSGTKPLNTTIAQTLQLSAQWSVASVTRSITIEGAEWKILKRT